MTDFLNLIKGECISTIEGLTGRRADIGEGVVGGISSLNITPPFAKITLEANSEKLLFIAPNALCVALADLMLGGEMVDSAIGDIQVSNDDLDATKEIVANIFSALSTALKAQKSLPPLDFKVTNAEILQGNMRFGGFEKGCEFAFNLAQLHSNFVILFNSELENAILGKAESTPKPPKDLANSGDSAILGSAQSRNIAMLLDVKMQVRVRIGQKKMLLKDVISMDIGSVIELNQLANDPLDILVDDKVIAKGEVVIIDGNFGVQITEIGTKKERLEQLKG
ncbi:flagellar motor switch protein FliY [Helicobacter sp. 23-1045]